MTEWLSSEQLELVEQLKQFETKPDEWKKQFAAVMNKPRYSDIFKPFQRDPEIRTDDNDAFSKASEVTINDILPTYSPENAGFLRPSKNPYADPYAIDCVSVFDAWEPEALDYIKDQDAETNEEETDEDGLDDDQDETSGITAPSQIKSRDPTN